MILVGGRRTLFEEVSLAAHHKDRATRVWFDVVVLEPLVGTAVSADFFDEFLVLHTHAGRK